MPPKTSATKPKPLPRVRGWVFTLNNYKPADLLHLQSITCKHLVYGCEVAASGTPHVQGYIELENKVGCAALCKLLGGHVHLEPRLGTPAEARDYCLKGEQSHDEWKELGAQGPSFGKNAVTFEKGSPLTPGKRTDILNVREAALTQSMAEIVGNSDFNYQDILIAKEVKKYCTTGRDWMTRVIWLYGPSGTGKSTFARQLCADEGYPDPHYHDKAGTWWDGYDGHEAVILDDFRDHWWPMSYNNNMLTGHNFRVEVKHGSAWFVPKLIVYTSILPPSEQYKGVASDREPLKQLLRRITEIYRFTGIRDTSGPRFVDESVSFPPETLDFTELRRLRELRKSDQRSGKVIVEAPLATGCPSASMTLPDSLLVDDGFAVDDGGDNVAIDVTPTTLSRTAQEYAEYLLDSTHPWFGFYGSAPSEDV